MSPFIEKFLPEKTIPYFSKTLGITKEGETKVLHLVAGNLFGGIEKMLVSIAKNSNLIPEIQNSFAMCFEGMLKDQLTKLRQDVYMLGGASFRNPISMFKSRRKLLKILSEFKFDWVICHGSWVHALFGKIVRKTNAKLAHMIHGIVSKLSIQDKLSIVIKPDLVLANSLASKTTAKKLFPETITKIVYPPCEIKSNCDWILLGQELRKKYGVDNDRFVIFSAGRMEYGKGFDILLEALGLIKENPRWDCWIAGEPQRNFEKYYFDDLKKIACKCGIESRIKWLGHVHEIQSYFAASNVYCQPNRLPESFGMTFVEAQAAGCPVITTAMGGSLETVERNQANKLIEYPDAKSVAASIRTFLEK